MHQSAVLLKNPVVSAVVVQLRESFDVSMSEKLANISSVYFVHKQSYRKSKKAVTCYRKSKKAVLNISL